jgi:hypothetical protein
MPLLISLPTCTHDDRDAIGLQVVQDAVGMAVHIAVQLRQRVAGPGGRLGLLARIGPAVAVVEVDQDALALRGSALGLVQHVRAIVPAAARVDPHAQADRIHLQVLQQHKRIGLHAAAVVERVAARFLLADPAHIGPVGKGGAARGQGERQPAGCEQPCFQFHNVSSVFSFKGMNTSLPLHAASCKQRVTAEM